MKAPSTTPLDFARSPVARRSISREVLDQNQRNRLLAGAAISVGTRGYLATSVRQIVNDAGLATNSFSRHFDDRDQCITAAYERTISWLETAVTEAVSPTRPWPTQLRAVVRKLLELLDTDPRLPRLCAVEIFVAGPEAATRHRALVDRWSLWLGIGRGERALGAGLPRRLEPALIGGGVSLIARRLGTGEPFVGLAPELDEYLLAPYKGVRAARHLAHAGAGSTA